jgi:hypothetical protein
MSVDELRLRQIEERQAVLDFREENEEVFAKYPDAKKDAKLIMQKARAAELTAEQVCVALYGSAGRPEHETRALKAAMGEPTRETRGSEKAERTKGRSESDENIQLSASDRRLKAELERRFNKGKPITAKEYLQYSRK